VPHLAPQWRWLGKELEAADHLMNIIQYDHPNDCETCCSRMLTEWLDGNPNACWEDVISAISNLKYYGMSLYVYMMPVYNSVVPFIVL